MEGCKTEKMEIVKSVNVLRDGHENEQPDKQLERTDRLVYG